MTHQNTSQLLMIRPVNFGYNEQTAVNNAFQEPGGDEHTQEKALAEFDALAAALLEQRIQVQIVQDTPYPETPDSIFPNNWISTHSNGTAVLFPMFAPNRRLERKAGVMEQIRRIFRIKKILDLTPHEKKGEFLEGTGSMVLDRKNHFAYACLSERTSPAILNEFCRKIGYTPVSFHATDAEGKPIYHTNVMMCVADRYVVICLDSIRDPQEREYVIGEIKKSDKVVVEIGMDQMANFAGNMLQVENILREKYLVMSSRAFASLTPQQVTLLRSFNEIIHVPLDTIEKYGGGSARCMLAEIFLPKYDPDKLN